jgi:hypothetical protein
MPVKVFRVLASCNSHLLWVNPVDGPATTFPASRLRACIKQASANILDKDDLAFFTACFPQFETQNRLSTGLAKRSLKLIFSSYGIKPIDGSRVRRYSGTNDLPRSCYYTVCSDDRGNDNGTLCWELMTSAAPSRLCDYPTPAGGLNWETLRASLRNMDKWADEGIEPPASNYPSLSNGTLVSLQQAAASFPVIPEVSFPTVYDTYELLVFGPLFNSLGGILTIQPPLNGPPYVIRLPKTDRDGDSACRRTSNRVARTPWDEHWMESPDAGASRTQSLRTYWIILPICGHQSRARG